MSAASRPPLRVVLAKLGLDGHDRGLKVVGRILRDTGMEVIYLGLRQTTDTVVAAVEQEDADVVGMCVQLEAEAALLPADERTEMLEGLGLGEGALPRFVHAAYHRLGLRTFFTTGEKESRAWTFRAGSTAPECAGRIHTDFQRGFIRAETIAWDVLVKKGSWAGSRAAGLIRSEGKDYRPVDGDVMEFRFNI